MGFKEIIAGLFGGRNPIDSVADILKGAGVLKDPEAEQKARDALMAWQLSLEQNEGKVLESINATMRAEAASEHWPQYSWRPAIGFAVAVQCLSLGVAFAYLVFKIAAGQSLPGDVLSNLSQVMGAMLGLFGLETTVLGVSAWYRGKEKVELAKNGKNGNGNANAS